MKTFLRNNFNNIKIVLKYGGLSAVILLILIFFTGVVNPINTVLLSNLVNVGINDFSRHRISSNLIIYASLFLLILVYYNVYNLIYDYLKVKISQRMRDQLLPVIIHKTYKLEYSNFEDPEIRNLISRVGSSPDIQFTTIFWQSLYLPSAIISLIGYLVIFLKTSYSLLVFILLISFIAIWIELRASNAIYQHQIAKTIETRKANYLSHLITSKEALHENRTFQSYEYLNNQWKNLQTELTKSKMRLNIKLARKSSRVSILSALITLCSISFFIYLLSKDIIDYGNFVAYISAIIVLIDLVTWEIPYSLSQLNTYSMYWVDFEKFMNLNEEDNDGYIDIDNFEKIEFRDVYFKYPNSEVEVLKGLTCTIHKNDSITIVGPNAAGKSTMIKLLLRLYKPQRGVILVDNYNLNDLTKKSIIKLFSPVFQEFYNYKLTIRENIAFGNIEEIDNDEQLFEAIEAVMLKDDYEKFPAGLNTYLGKVFYDGIDLSGGQWQKVALARAFFSNSPIVILDEPTSALDPKMEAKIYEDFKKIIPNKTSIFISHRLGIARLSQKILVIDDGKVIEEGTHEELMQKQGQYYQMFTAQSEWYR